MKKQHPNIGIIKQFNPANINNSADVIGKDAVFHYFNPLLPDLQGDYIGLEGFNCFFKKITDISHGRFKVEPIAVTACGDELVVVHSKNTIVFQGEQKLIDVVIVWRIVDGLIHEVWDIPSLHTARVTELMNR